MKAANHSPNDLPPVKALSEFRRPESLFPLFGGIEQLGRSVARNAELFARLNLKRPRDLLFHLPRGVTDRRRHATVLDVDLPRILTVEVEVGVHRPPRRRGQPYVVPVFDGKARFEVVYFPRWTHAIAKRELPEGSRRIISGMVERYGSRIQMRSPDCYADAETPNKIPQFEAVYPATKGLSPGVMRTAIAESLQRAGNAAKKLETDWIGPELKQNLGLMDWGQALWMVHHPQKEADLLPGAPARQRLAFDEIFAWQLRLARSRAKRLNDGGRVTAGDGRLRYKLFGNPRTGDDKGLLPFTLTGAQKRVIDEIIADMASRHRMARLVNGDVGSGKTIVAIAALLNAVEAGGQGAVLVPTTILAEQHYRTFKALLELIGVRCELLTGAAKAAERRRILGVLACGKVDIIIGTHALFQDAVQFADLRLAVIDEQHRLGVAQRARLAGKGEKTDVLIMSATPIPRSAALGEFGNLEMSRLDESPPGRQKTRTSAVPITRLDELSRRLSRQIEQGKQAFWVCPFIGAGTKGTRPPAGDESAKSTSEEGATAAAEARFAHLHKALAPIPIGLAHGRKPARENSATLNRFERREIQLLVATVVVEVGVDVPAADIMIIEGAEHFGLAQLHQLRGRVGRNERKGGACVLLHHPPLSDTQHARLDVLRNSHDGFVIAEKDLQMRGHGQLLGTVQSGKPFRIADDVAQQRMTPLAHQEARALVASDPQLRTPRGQAAQFLVALMDGM